MNTYLVKLSGKSDLVEYYVSKALDYRGFPVGKVKVKGKNSSVELMFASQPTSFVTEAKEHLKVVESVGNTDDMDKPKSSGRPVMTKQKPQPDCLICGEPTMAYGTKTKNGFTVWAKFCKAHLQAYKKLNKIKGQ